MELRIEKLHKQAVDAAVGQNWDEAIALHMHILDINENYEDAHLGLGYAYLQKGDYKNAKKYYLSALKLDPVNQIARNNLDKINILLKKGPTSDDDNDEISLRADMFMHIEGKTLDVTLSNIGQADVLAKLKIGQKVELIVKKHRIEVRNRKGEYIGCLPDDVAKRLAFFINAKSIYETIVKSSTKNSVDVFIKESKKGTRVNNFISFPDNIQEDLKKIIGNTNPDDKESKDSDESDEDDEDEDSEFEDLEELAKKSEEEPEEDLMSEIEGSDDDEYDYEDE